MRVKQSFWVNHSNPENLEWLVVTENRNLGQRWYDCLPMTDSTLFDHFQWQGRLRDLSKIGYSRVKLEDCPFYVPIHAKRELS
jgi:hypothetical protein